MATVSMAMPLPAVAAKKQLQPPTSGGFIQPLKVKESTPFVAACSKSKLKVEASLKQKAVAGITAAGIAASMVVPEVAQAAYTLTPSLKNLLFSIVAGGVVLAAIAGAIVGVSNFDPVKRS